MKYLFCNVLEPLPFEADSFDVVHLRIVLYHVCSLFLEDQPPPNIIQIASYQILALEA